MTVKLTYKFRTCKECPFLQLDKATGGYDCTGKKYGIPFRVRDINSVHINCPLVLGPEVMQCYRFHIGVRKDNTLKAHLSGNLGTFGLSDYSGKVSLEEFIREVLAILGVSTIEHIRNEYVYVKRTNNCVYAISSDGTNWYMPTAI
jgi:hypothetical protein